ncbi:MAG: hypothetical protein ACI88A_002786, partial [Paraglaciecola sp.]
VARPEKYSAKGNVHKEAKDAFCTGKCFPDQNDKNRAFYGFICPGHSILTI